MPSAINRIKGAEGVGAAVSPGCWIAQRIAHPMKHGRPGHTAFKVASNFITHFEPGDDGRPNRGRWTRVSRVSLRLAGEPLFWSVHRDGVAAFLAKRGWRREVPRAQA